MPPQQPIFTSLYRRRVLKLSAFGVVGYSLVVLLYAYLIPNLGIEVFGRAPATFGLVNDRPGLLVRQVDRPPAWPPAEQGVHPVPGDRLVSIAGVDIDTLPRYVNTVAHLRETGRFPVAYGLKSTAALAELRENDVAEIDRKLYARIGFQQLHRVEETQSAAVDLPVLYAWVEVGGIPLNELAISIAWFAMDSLLFWIGWLVYRRRPEDDSAALFFLMCIVTVGAYMGGYHWLRIASEPALIFVFALCAMALPQVTLHFYLLFPTPKAFVAKHPRLTFWLLYGLPSFLQVGVLCTIG
ncbi:MAG: hypothetical protein ACRDD1_16640, partial [Planctomycetia bacterium]